MSEVVVERGNPPPRLYAILFSISFQIHARFDPLRGPPRRTAERASLDDQELCTKTGIAVRRVSFLSFSSLFLSLSFFPVTLPKNSPIKSDYLSEQIDIEQTKPTSVPCYRWLLTREDGFISFFSIFVPRIQGNGHSTDNTNIETIDRNTMLR